MLVKNLMWATLMAGVLGSCKSSSDPQPGGKMVTFQPIKVTVSEAGAPSYELLEAHVINSNYQSGSSSLTITGRLNSGKSLTVNFYRGASNPPARTTDAADATLDGVAGTAVTGATVYNLQSQKVTGNFSATFPTPGTVKGNFTDILLP